MVGTGFLTLPHAMVQSGLVLGVAVLVLMSLLSVVRVCVLAIVPSFAWCCERTIQFLFEKIASS